MPDKSSNTSVIQYTVKSSTPLSRCLSMLRGVNSRGVGVGGSTIVHGYRMCLGGYAAWVPSVRISHSALLSHFVTFSAPPLLLPPLRSLFLHIFCPFSLPSLNPLSRFLSSFRSLTSHHTWPLLQHEVISSLKRDGEVRVSETHKTLTSGAKTWPPLSRSVCKNMPGCFFLYLELLQMISDE